MATCPILRRMAEGAALTSGLVTGRTPVLQRLAQILAHLFVLGTKLLGHAQMFDCLVVASEAQKRGPQVEARREVARIETESVSKMLDGFFGLAFVERDDAKIAMRPGHSRFQRSRRRKAL